MSLVTVVGVAHIPELGSNSWFRKHKKVGFFEWRDCWFCKVSVRKLFSLSSCLSEV